MNIKRVSSFILDGVFWGFVLVGILIALALFPIFPTRLFSVLSGSMEPAILTGSIVITQGTGEYSIGDVVTRKTEDPKVTITHRIIGIEQKDGESVFLLKGDANSSKDMEGVRLEAIIGKVFFSVPYLGFAVEYAKKPVGFIILVVIPAVIIIYEELGKIRKEIARLWRRRKENKKDKQEVPTEEEH